MVYFGAVPELDAVAARCARRGTGNEDSDEWTSLPVLEDELFPRRLVSQGGTPGTRPISAYREHVSGC